MRDEDVHSRQAFAPVSKFVVVDTTKVVTAGLGHLPIRRAEQPARSSWTPRIIQQA